jgi:hypothetical protein
MKHGRKPSRKQKIMLKECGLTPENWLVVRHLAGQLQLKNRTTGRMRVILFV